MLCFQHFGHWWQDVSEVDAAIVNGKAAPVLGRPVDVELVAKDFSR